MKRLRFHGSKDKVVFDEVGYNSRLDDLQAAIIRVFYPHLDAWNAARAQAAAWYAEEGLGEVMTLPGVADGATHIYHLYMARHPRRDDLRAALSGPAWRAPSTTASRCTCSRCSRRSATPRATCPWRRSAPAPPSRCRCTPT